MRALCDQVARGLIPSGQQQPAHAVDLVLREPATVDLFREQTGDEIPLARRAATIRDDVEEVGVQRLLRRLALPGVRRVELADDGIRPATEGVGVAARNAQQLRDHDRGQWRRYAIHELERFATRQRIDQRARDLADARLERSGFGAARRSRGSACAARGGAVGR